MKKINQGSENDILFEVARVRALRVQLLHRGLNCVKELTQQKE